MRALLDTHVLLWLADNPSNLPREVVALCEDDANELYIGIASFWELAIKMSLGKIELADNALERLQTWCSENAIGVLPVEVKHCQRVQTLPFHHRDPFDRLLIAQADCENLAIVSADEQFSAYGVEVIWR